MFKKKLDPCFFLGFYEEKKNSDNWTYFSFRVFFEKTSYNSDLGISTSRKKLDFFLIALALFLLLLLLQP